jgi:hypothetical protein
MSAHISKSSKIQNNLIFKVDFVCIFKATFNKRNKNQIIGLPRINEWI